jgi:radical SAM superfamily enzyme YgiQ (UPF0313 family)
LRVKKKPLVLLVQLPIPPLGPGPLRGNVPLASGYLKLWARGRGLDEHCDIEILPAAEANRLGDEALLERIAGARPHVAAFTCYLWNIERTLWVARALKARLPSAIVVLGGPEITPDNAWVLEAGAHDFAVVGEGEQTFAELLAALAAGGWRAGDGAREGEGPTVGGIAGLAYRAGGAAVMNARRQPLPDLDAISSPYLEGILDAGDEEQLLLETVRGCIFKCKFCYYPKAYDRLYFVSREKIAANLAHARDHGAREVYILDPTLNQRRDFPEFLALLGEGNPSGTLEYHAELRAEGIRPEHARLMRQAGFREVEVGLQSVDPVAQDLMERRNSLKSFERGVRALRAEGVRVKVDLIVGLPGDTVDSVRRGIHYLAEGGLYDDVQVFQLAVLPGTDFRRDAARLGLEFQPRPPYYVLETPSLGLADIARLQREAEEVFGVEFDAAPAPSLEAAASSAPIDIDAERAHETAPPFPAGGPGHAATLWFRTRDPYARLPAAARVIREVLARSPFTALEVVVETGRDFPLDVYKALRAAAARPEESYLERFYALTSRAGLGRVRMVTVLPAARRPAIDPDWVDDALLHSDVVWVEEGAGESGLAEGDVPGVWSWRRGAQREGRAPTACSPRGTPGGGTGSPLPS